MKQNAVAVLDFGSEKLTVLVGRRGINNTLAIDGRGEAVYSGFAEGTFFQPDKLGQAVSVAINAAENMAQTKITSLYVGVPGDFTVCISKSVAVSFGGKKRITDSDVNSLHQKNEEPADPDLVLLNTQPVYYTISDERRLIEPVGMQSSVLSGLISYLYAERYFVDTVTAILRDLGISNIEFTSSVLAEVLFLFDARKRDQYVVLIDVGYLTTTVSVARGDGILSLHTFSYGGVNITGEIARMLKIPFTDAEALKRKVSLSLSMSDTDYYEYEDGKYPAKVINEAVTEKIAVIAKAVYKCLDLCEYEIPQNIPFSLTGGGISYIRGAKDVFSSMLMRQVELSVPKIPQLDMPHLSSSLGLLDMALNVEMPEKRGLWAKIFRK